jgi:hypothetical protein
VDAVSELAEFLLARITEDEELAKRGYNVTVEWSIYPPTGVSVDPRLGPGWFQPSRVLAECAAKRLVLQWEDHEGQGFPRFFVDHMHRAFALPYADHPDYREEWRP